MNKQIDIHKLVWYNLIKYRGDCMGLFKSLFRYGVGRSLSEKNKNLAGLAYMETMNYFESLSQIEEDERKWNKRS